MTSDVPLEDLARGALDGDASAVERLVRVLQTNVYNLAMRMLGHPADAEDATQEIILKIVTRLDSYRGESSLRTWAWRVATNHLASMRRGRREPEAFDFDTLDGMLAAGLAAAHAPPEPDPERAVLEEEVRLGCTQSMLACLDRDHRVAFILADVFDIDGREGAEILGITPAAFRKRLSRARGRMRDFMQARCGLVNDAAACRCERQIGPSIEAGLIDPDALLYATHPTSDERVARQHEAIAAVSKVAEVHRGHPTYRPPDDLADRIQRMVAASPP